MKKYYLFFVVILFTVSAFAGLDGKYFPGVPDDELKYKPAALMSAGEWKVPAGFSVTSDEDGLFLCSKIPHFPAYEISSAGNIRLPEKGQMIKVTTRFFCKTAYTGTKIVFFLRQYDSNGHELRVDRVATGGETPSDFQVWHEEYVPRHPQGTYGKLIAQFSGNPLTIQLTELKLEGVDRRAKAKILPSNTFMSQKYLSDSALDAALAKRRKLHASLKNNGDQVQFMINGKPEPFKMLKDSPYTYNAGSADFRRHIPLLKRAGFNIFSVCVNLGVPGNTRVANSVWLGENQYQIEVIRRALRRILRYCPDAMIMLELNITPHVGWGEANPSEIAMAENGKKIVFAGPRPAYLSDKPPVNYQPRKSAPWTAEYWVPSYYSEKFTAAASKALTDIFMALEATPESKALIGGFLTRATDGQWFDISSEATSLNGMADYSSVSLEQFKNYLRMRYDNDVNKLRDAWGDPDADFDTVRIPAYKEFFITDGIVRRIGRDHVGDFIASRAFGMSRQFASFCRAIKRATDNRVLVGGYRAEGAIVSYPFFTQQCSKEMYKVPEIDFFASCPGGRTPEDPVATWGLNGSMRMRSKLVLTELDFRSPSVNNWASWGTAIWYKTHDVKEFGERTMRAQLFALAHGGSFYAYDMDGGWYDHEQVRACWERNNRIVDHRQPRPLGLDRAALFYSEHEWEHLALDSFRSFAHAARRNPLQAFARSGVDTDNYLLDDAFNPDLKAPQLICIVSGSELTKEKAHELRQRFGNNNRVILWMWGPGVGTTENISEVTGFDLIRFPKADGKAIIAAENVKDPLLENVSGLLLPAMNNVYCLGTAWKVIDPKAKILGYYFGTDIPAMAVKRYAGHTEIYIGQAGSLTPQFIRNAAKIAGAHCWLETNDPVALAGNLLTVSAASSGTKVIRLKQGMKCLRALTPHEIAISGNTVKVDMKYGEVLVLEME